VHYAGGQPFLGISAPAGLRVVGDGIKIVARTPGYEFRPLCPAVSATGSPDSSPRMPRDSLTIRHLVTRVLSDERTTVDWMINRGLLPGELACDACSLAMHLEVGQQERVRFRCWQCNRSESIRQGTVFSLSRLPLSTLVHLSRLWFYKTPQTVARGETGVVSNHTSSNWYQLCREVCLAAVMDQALQLAVPTGSLRSTRRSLDA
jgi:transposase-like protein